MSRKWLVLTPLFGLPAMALIFSKALGGAPDQAAPVPAPAVLVKTLAPSSEGPLTRRGVVVAGSRLRLSFKTGGVLGAILVREGDMVRKGQVLARLDPADALAQVRSAEAGADKARRDAAVAERLSQRGALAVRARDDARSQLESAEAGLSLAREALRRTQLSAPAAGTVFQRTAEPGEAIGPGVPVLLVDETERLVVKVGVTERDLSRLRPGQAASLVPGDGGPDLPGRITSLSPTPEPADGLYTVQVTPDTAGPGLKERLHPGVLATVRFAGGAAADVVRVPLLSLVHRQDRDFVFVVSGAPEHPVARLRPVALGRSEGWEVIVRSDLHAGERIVTEGAAFLQDGQPIRALN